jgi:hypothetical protein
VVGRFSASWFKVQGSKFRVRIGTGN